MNTTTDYQQQAIDFLQSTNTEFSCEYLRSGKYFHDDTESRDIYQITLKRGKRSFSFEFGQSISDSGFYYTKGARKTPIDRKHLDNKNIVSFIKRNDYDFMNNGKSDKIHRPKNPTAYDVLVCLTKSEPGTFEDFCSEFGYDTDSKKAEKIYNAVSNEWLNISKLFTDSEIEQLQEIN